MSTSEILVKTVQHCLAHETISENTKSAIDTLINAYQGQVKASLRLEETIHKMVKERER